MFRFTPVIVTLWLLLCAIPASASAAILHPLRFLHNHVCRPVEAADQVISTGFALAEALPYFAVGLIAAIIGIAIGFASKWRATLKAK